MNQIWIFKNYESNLNISKIYLHYLLHREETLGEGTDGDVGTEILKMVLTCLSNTAFKRNLRVSRIWETTLVEKPALLIMREGAFSTFLLNSSKINFISLKYYLWNIYTRLAEWSKAWDSSSYNLKIARVRIPHLVTFLSSSFTVLKLIYKPKILFLKYIYKVGRVV